MNGFKKLRIAEDGLRIVKTFCLLLGFFGVSVLAAKAQSINQNFPTAITSNEISGQIPARDIGDARLTSYFYAFNASQGDVFINVMTTNLNGDIDIFTQNNLRPLSKITVYADASDGETGRIVYLRQPTKLILRIEGRSPNDNAAIYRIKFAGSFAPAEAAENADATAPQVKSDNQTDIRVNAVGTIIEIKPKASAPPKEAVAETKSAETKKQPLESETAIGEIRTEPAKAIEQTAVTEKKTTVENQKEAAAPIAVTDETPKKETVEVDNPTVNAPEKTEEARASVEPVKKKTVAKKRIVRKEIVAETTPPARKKPNVAKPIPATALENIRLIVLFKDGTKIERPMSDVLKVAVDKGILTVIGKGGQSNRYSILDVEKMTIE